MYIYLAYTQRLYTAHIQQFSIHSLLLNVNDVIRLSILLKIHDTYCTHKDWAAKGYGSAMQVRIHEKWSQLGGRSMLSPFSQSNPEYKRLPCTRWPSLSSPWWILDLSHRCLSQSPQFASIQHPNHSHWHTASRQYEDSRQGGRSSCRDNVWLSGLQPY